MLKFLIMKILESWLRDFIKTDLSGLELISLLTAAGLEVVNISHPTVPTFDKVVVGEIINLKLHPNADFLKIVEIDVGLPNLLQVVCGAPNIDLYSKVATALVGARLANGIEINSSLIRGVISNGMLCSAKEIGLQDYPEGLVNLSRDSKIGTNVRELLSSDNNNLIIDVDITPNRGDCLCVEGIARELAVITGSIFKEKDTTLTLPNQSISTIPVDCFEITNCPKYLYRIIENINPCLTPFWMQTRLNQSGIKPVGLATVDIINYVMLEVGQPMHIYDLNRINGAIEIRLSRNGEFLKLLNGTQLEFSSGDLLIADKIQPLSLAGIISGNTSSCTYQTNNIFIESAFFSRDSIIRSTRRYGIKTESSRRFEYGIAFDNLQKRAINRATQLLIEIVGGKPGPLVEKIYAAQLPIQPSIVFRPKRMSRVLGINIPNNNSLKILKDLGMEVIIQSPDYWLVKPPIRRLDINIEVDIFEEIARLYGYEKIYNDQLNKKSVIKTNYPELKFINKKLDTKISNILVQRGFREVINYSFTEPVLQNYIKPDSYNLVVSNPISKELSVMRSSLWPGLINSLVYNQKRQRNHIRLFESGLVFSLINGKIEQEKHISAIVNGLALPEQWDCSNRTVDFFDLKSDVEAILLSLGLKEDKFNFVFMEQSALDQNMSVRIEAIVGEEYLHIGWLGALRKNIARKFDIIGNTFLFELVINNLEKVPNKLKFKSFSRLPYSRRDIAFIVDESINFKEISDFICEQNNNNILREVKLFDLYRGSNIPKGKKSFALGLILQCVSKNITEYLIEETVSKIVTRVTEKFSATLRV